VATAAPSYRDRFQVIAEVGEGGFARVLRAREVATGRTVALKVLKDKFLADAEVVERFRREAFAFASVSSPHVVKMYDFGVTGAEVYIAMEFVEGPTLRDVLYDRLWTVGDIHLVIGQIAEALAAAHRQQVVHRDLKPENVILVAGPKDARTVKVLDFGLAKLAGLERKLELEPLTRAGMCYGTPQYMAPELIQGKPVDRAVDIYALGVMTYELLSGSLPWDGPDAREVLLAVASTPPPPIARAHPSVTRLSEVNAFLQRALAKDKKHRPGDAATFFRELELALIGERKKKSSGDAVFADVVSAAIKLTAPKKEDDTFVDSEPTTERTSVDVRRNRRLHSSWMESLAGVPALPPPPTGPRPLPTAQPFDAESAPTMQMQSRRVITGQVRPAKMPRRRPTWLVPVLIVLALLGLAVGVGYFFGRQSR
jgi:serine/threonine-protein kinase